jgi:hypothetical protein
MRRRIIPDPLATLAFTSLRAVTWSLAEGGIPPASKRTPADEARIVTLFALGELLRLLDSFRRARLRGEAVRLRVEARRRSRRHVTIELRIVSTSPT